MSDIAIEWDEQTVPVASLKPYERNPRRITKVAFDRLKKSLKDMGYHQRIITQPDLRVVGGHQRIRALQELGVKDVKILVANRDLTEAEFKQILIQDNLPFGDFDIDIIASDFEIAELKEWGFDEKLLLGAKSYADEEDEDAPAVQAKIITKPGDLWLLGNHRLVCGDATNADDVKKTLCDQMPGLMITDPPYGVEYSPEWRNERDRANGDKIGARATGKVKNDDRADWREAFALFPGNIVYAWCASLFSDVAIVAIESAGFERRAQIVWGKSNFAISQGHYHWQHEPCWYAVRKGQNANWVGDRKQTTLWSIDKPQKSETGHSTQKPIECMRRPMINHTDEGDFVYDPFLGSGTTIIAAEQTKRLCLGLEISPAYCDVIIRRFLKFAPDQRALHVESNKSFGELEISGQ